MFRTRSSEKELKMIWEVKKGDKTSFLVGTAHFFPYSFRTSLSRYMKDATTILFEGPLDENNMARVAETGRAKENTPHFFTHLDKQTIASISNALAFPRRDWVPFLSFNPRKPTAEDPVYAMVKGMKPWMAFFTIWTTCLEQKGWRDSVDMEGYRIAREMGKNVVFLETIEEQIEVLESLSLERIIGFLAQADQWDAYAQKYVKYYLKGDLEKLKSLSRGFATRSISVIDRRDRILYERMLVYLEKGNAVVFVGAPHIGGITDMLRESSYQIVGCGKSVSAEP